MVLNDRLFSIPLCCDPHHIGFARARTLSAAQPMTGCIGQERKMKEAMKFAIGTAVMIAVAFAVTAASAKPIPGGNPHPHHHWHGGGFFVGTDTYPADCWLVKRYTRSGRPYLAEVCG
jgi:hypothetical protein